MLNLRNTAAAAAALALALAPAAAQAKKAPVEEGTYVCNTASQNWQGGDLAVSDQDPQGYIHFNDNLRTKKVNAGLVNAAMHSRALALCGDGSDDDAPVGGGDAGDGGGDAEPGGPPIGGGGDGTIGGGTA